MRDPLGQADGQSGRLVQRKNMHAGGQPGFDARQAVFDDGAVFRRDAHVLGGEQKEARVGLEKTAFVG